MIAPLHSILGNRARPYPSPTKKEKNKKVVLNEMLLKITFEQWLMLVIPALWEAKVGRSPEFRSLRSAWTTWRNPISTKNTKLTGHGSACL